MIVTEEGTKLSIQMPGAVLSLDNGVRITLSDSGPVELTPRACKILEVATKYLSDLRRAELPEGGEVMK